MFSLSFEVPAWSRPPSNSPLPCRYTRCYSIYSCFFKIHFNIIRPYKHSFPKWGPKFRVTFPDTSRIFTSPPYVPHAPPICSSSISPPLQQLVSGRHHGPPLNSIPIVANTIFNSLSLSQRPHCCPHLQNYCVDLNIYSSCLRNFHHATFTRLTPHLSFLLTHNLSILRIKSTMWSISGAGNNLKYNNQYPDLF